MKRFLFGFAMMAALGGMVLADDKTDKGSAVKGDDKTAAETKILEGTWDIEAFEVMGKKIPAPQGKGGSIVFAKNMKVIMKDPKGNKDGTYKLDVSKTPKTLDLIETKDGKPGEVLPVIYEIDGDKMKMGFSGEGPKGKRPTSFEGEKVAILYLKRQKS
jgi:uncharacterized protein (TIGR03067 family)